jgi:hypothetical protein
VSPEWLEFMDSLPLTATAILLEKEQELLTGASGGNSGIFHCGFDSPLNTIEQACIREGTAIFCVLFLFVLSLVLCLIAALLFFDSCQRL